MSKIPVNATIKSAVMSVYLFGTMQLEGKCGVYRITTGWNENGVSWVLPWKNAGGDYTSTAETEARIKSVGIEGYNDMTLTKAVQDFVKNPGSNLGFILILIPDDGEKVCRQIAMSENSDQNMRPKLTVTYSGGTGVLNEKSLNPNNGGIQIRLYAGMLLIKGANSPIHKIDIYSITGQRIYGVSRFDVKSENALLSIPFEKRGVFIVKIMGGCGIWIKEIIYR